ncbi:hypothetical protein PEBR_42913 [Penicillium brasilianum]|uniref:Uncharacterized protein n=1 Tax=Penicillium brasilianum TaxID=104259 RepID=A0A1S9R885_PENBI|nr:hypothetical protein PEBR_42913 [Penicillium brasilianum]
MATISRERGYHHGATNSFKATETKTSLPLDCFESTHGCGDNYWLPLGRIVSSGLNLQADPSGRTPSSKRSHPPSRMNPTGIWSEKDQTYLIYNIVCPQNVPFTCHNLNITCGPGNTLNGESSISLWSSPDLYTAYRGVGVNLNGE